jgi:hypothetical protein
MDRFFGGISGAQQVIKSHRCLQIPNLYMDMSAPGSGVINFATENWH